MDNRRSFLRGLTTLPLIGGSVALIGKPTAAATPVTWELMQSYKSWLHMEHRMLCYELGGWNVEAAKGLERGFFLDNPGSEWHFQWSDGNKRVAGWQTAPQPSTRAAVILSAAGVPLTGGRDHG